MTDDAALIARLRDPVYAHKRKDELEAADRIAALTAELEASYTEAEFKSAQRMAEQEAARAAKAEAERDALIDMQRVLGEETVLAGYPSGDRKQTLANVRAMRAEFARLKDHCDEGWHQAKRSAAECVRLAEALSKAEHEGKP